MQRMAGMWWSSVILALGAAAGCVPEPGPDPGSDVLMHDALLVAIPRQLDGPAAARKQDTLARLGTPGELRGGPPPADFYLAVRKSALAQRWFWSVYLKELQPFGPIPATLGTSVVRFREHNGKLYVFDADERRATSDVFHPDLIIDAFPIVDDGPFTRPARLRRLRPDRSGRGREPVRRALRPVRRRAAPGQARDRAVVRAGLPRRASDGGRFEQIITAYTDQPIGRPRRCREQRVPDRGHARRQPAPLHRVAELRAGARAVGADTTSSRDPFNVPEHRRRRRSSRRTGPSIPACTPIRWVIGRPRSIDDPGRPVARRRPTSTSAMKRGIESWNAAFGYPGVHGAARVTEPTRSPTITSNYLIVDPYPEPGLRVRRLAHEPEHRRDPRRERVLRRRLLRAAADDTALTPASLAPARAPRPSAPTLIWQDEPTAPLVRPLGARVRAAPGPRPRRCDQLAGAQKLELLIQYTITHEIGHTLGLRHNFKGSLVPPTSSVMELQPDRRRGRGGRAGHRTTLQALAYLLRPVAEPAGARRSAPMKSTLVDPNCVRFDPGTSPTRSPTIRSRRYTTFTRRLFDGTLPPIRHRTSIVTLSGTEMLALRARRHPGPGGRRVGRRPRGRRAPRSRRPTSRPIRPYGPAADALSARSCSARSCHRPAGGDHDALHRPRP